MRRASSPSSRSAGGERRLGAGFQQLRCHQALGDDLHLAPEVVTGQWADVHHDAQVAHYPHALVHHKGVLLTVRAGAQLVEAAGDRQPLGSPADLAVFLGTRRWTGLMPSRRPAQRLLAIFARSLALAALRRRSSNSPVEASGGSGRYQHGVAGRTATSASSRAKCQRRRYNGLTSITATIDPRSSRGSLRSRRRPFPRPIRRV